MTRPATGAVFEEWITNHRGIVIKIVRSFTSESADAEDLTQEIMLALWRSIPTFRGESKPSTWIWRIALNKAITWQRSTDPPAAGRDDQEAGRHPGPTAPDQADSVVLLDRIYGAIRTLSRLDRSLVVLSFEGYSYTEIADITGLSISNVGARLTRARSHLTDQLEEV